jgi:RNA 2',3'-cyclic 3'-phosphodiesterase
MGARKVGNSATVRAFVAVRINAEVEDSIARFIAHARAPGDGIAWTPRDKLHVTLKFLDAAIDPERLAPLSVALARVASATAGFEVHARGTGVFPNLRRPRVIWAGLESEALEHLARRVDEAASETGFASDKSRWSAHLTLGRVRDPHGAKSAARVVAVTREREFGVSGIHEMRLYRSHPAAGGAVYETLARFEFAAAVRIIPDGR